MLSDPDLFDRAVKNLLAQYSAVADEALIIRMVQESLDGLRHTGSRHPDLHAQALDFAASKLRALAMSLGALESDTPRVLFVCRANTGRSQMAAALLTYRSHGEMMARSAGVNPGPEVLPTAIAAMQEIGMPLTGMYPKPLDPVMARAAQYIITFDCADQVPQWEHVEYQPWDVRGITGSSLDDVRMVRNELNTRVEAFLHHVETQ